MCTYRAVLGLVFVCHVTSSAYVVRSPWGTVQGVDLEGRGGRKLSGYLGIPYALPPTGDLRWEKPVPHPGPGDGQVFVADTVKPACPQDVMIGVTAGISEDCLTLDVYVPVSVTSPRPVMVFIHGGGLLFGESALYRPAKLVDDGDVIVVAMQYRIGTLGFLSTGDETLPGNYGLWDQNLALRWVKDNIRAFGGDPDSVTLFGESAGSWSVGLQMLSPHSKGLFHRAVLQSGSPVSVVSVAADERAFYQSLVASFGCQQDSLRCLRSRTADEILRQTSSFLSFEIGAALPVSARVDGDFIPGDPLEITQDAQHVEMTGMGDIDVMMGINNKEGAAITVASEVAGGPQQDVTDYVTFRAVLQASVTMFNTRQPDGLLSDVVEFFYRGADFGTNQSVPLDALIDVYGDSWFNAPTVQWLRPLVTHPHTGKRYLYMLEHEFHFNKDKVIQGSHHGDDLFLEFDLQIPDNSVFSLLKKRHERCSAEDEKMSDLFVKMLTTFAKTGNPSGPLRDLLGGDWPEFTAENEACLLLSLAPRVESDVMRERMALWLKLVPQIISATHRQQQEPERRTQDKDEL